MRQRLLVNVFVVAALAAIVGCTKTVIVQQAPAAPAAPAAPQAPEWVNKGSGAFKDAQGGSVFYGVGMASGIRNRDLATTAADDSARAAISKIMDSYVANLTKKYQASTSTGDPGKSSEEQHVEVAMKAFSKFTLHGADIIDHYRDPSDGTLFSLCRLDMSAIQKSLEQSKDIDSKVRDFVRTNAEKAHDDLSAEEAKH